MFLKYDDIDTLQKALKYKNEKQEENSNVTKIETCSENSEAQLGILKNRRKSSDISSNVPPLISIINSSDSQNVVFYYLLISFVINRYYFIGCRSRKYI